MTDGVVLAHDYATQRGGAERVALLLAAAFPGSPMYTTLYDPSRTFPGFADVDLRLSGLDRNGLLRRHHRLALPLLARAVDEQRVDGDVLLASSTGWAHGYRGARRTVVYCHAPARWLYQRDRYLGARPDAGWRDRVKGALVGTGLSVVERRLRTWDHTAARRADVYLANSTVTRDAVRAAYGVEAEILPPPAALPLGGSAVPPAVPGGALEPGFLLCVARLLPYKNVDAVIEAAALSGRHLVVVGEGPDRARLTQLASRLGPSRVHLLGRVPDAELRWLYRHASLLVAASYEDFGLTPLEAGSFGAPVVALRGGGYLDTVVEGVNGFFFDRPDAALIAEAVERASSARWSTAEIGAHLERFSEGHFVDRLRAVVGQQLESARPASETAVPSTAGRVMEEAA
ncbi:glycosyltransferase [Isoptericola sp. NPDC055881]